MTLPLQPRPRPSWKTGLVTPQIGPMAEDLLGVALTAAAGGAATIGRPQMDKGIDLYLRRLKSMFVLPIQVKASLLVDQDGSSTFTIAVADLRNLSGGCLAVVHLPPPHDQLYSRLFLIPDDEFRKRAARVTHNRVPCYQFVARFAGDVDERWSPFAIEIERLSEWLEALPGWRSRLRAEPEEAIAPGASRTENQEQAALGSLWVSAELERTARSRVVLVEDRVRLDSVTLLVHDLETQLFAGLRLRTAVFNETRRIHFDVKKPHFFMDGRLWVALILLHTDLRIHDYCLVIPSKDIPKLGFSETLTLDPLTKRFRPYQVPSSEFAGVFMKAAFGNGAKQIGRRAELPKAS